MGRNPVCRSHSGWGALVHKSSKRRNSFIQDKQSANPITLRHAQMGHLVERPTADQCLSGLRFQ